MQKKLGKHVQQKLNTKLEEGGTLAFNGASIYLNKGVHPIYKNFNINQLHKIPTDRGEINKASFISQSARGAYIDSLSRRHLTAGFAITAQRQGPTKENVIQLNKRQQKAENNSLNPAPSTRNVFVYLYSPT